MADINHVTLVGRLTRNAELKYTGGGQPCCKFGLAVDTPKKNGDQWVKEANFFDIVSWGRQGEAINQYLLKGKQVGVEGRLRQNRWEQDGQSRSKVEIVATNIMLLGGGGGQNGSGQGGSQGSYQNRRSEAAPNPAPAAAGSPQQAPDDGFSDDIPF
jgi:single-strand DNA-binding protein